MLKLNASYSKKVPADTEYSSQSYHASIEVEIPDGLTAEQLQSRIHETFDLVRNSVETELHGGNCTTVQQIPQSPQSYSGGRVVTAREKAVRMLMVPRLRNRSSICSTSQETPMSRLSRSRQGSG